jgi:hypothetical protein
VSDASAFRYVPVRAGYALDECHLDKSGRWLLVLETAPSGALDNRVVDVSTGQTTPITDAAGALGNLDAGFGYAVGADNYNPLPNASILLKFPLAATERPLGPVVQGNLESPAVISSWTANLGGKRLDAFLVKVPGDLLGIGRKGGKRQGSGTPEP